MKNSQKILITGAAGYIGSLLCRKLLDNGYRIIFLDKSQRLSPDIQEITNHFNCETIYCDLLDLKLIESKVIDVDVIIHLGAISDGIQGLKNPDYTIALNYEVTKALANIAKKNGVKRFLFASTFGVYGDSYNQPLTENLLMKPVEPYSISKAKSEEYLHKISDSYFTTCSLRISTVFGLSLVTKYELLVNQLCKIACISRELKILGGGQKRPQIYVQDITEFLLKLITIKNNLINGESFNAVSINTDLFEISNTIKSILPDTQLIYLPQRDNEKSYEMDSSRTENELGIKFDKNLKTGVKELITNIKGD